MVKKYCSVIYGSKLLIFFFWQVGKGLCKVGNAKKPALQHWLEAVSLMLEVNLWTKLLVLFVACFQFC